MIGFIHLVAYTRGRCSDARIAVICHFRDGQILSFRGRDRDELIEELDLPGSARWRNVIPRVYVALHAPPVLPACDRRAAACRLRRIGRRRSAPGPRRPPSRAPRRARPGSRSTPPASASSRPTPAAAQRPTRSAPTRWPRSPTRRQLPRSHAGDDRDELRAADRYALYGLSRITGIGTHFSRSHSRAGLVFGAAGDKLTEVRSVGPTDRPARPRRSPPTRAGTSLRASASARTTRASTSRCISSCAAAATRRCRRFA